MGGEGEGEGIEVADEGVQGGVAFGAGEGVAFEVFLVEEHIHHLICFCRRLASSFLGVGDGEGEGKEEGRTVPT